MLWWRANLGIAVGSVSVVWPGPVLGYLLLAVLSSATGILAGRVRAAR